DGDLDLMTTTSYCCNKLLRNDGLGAFTEATSGFLFQENEFSMGAAWADREGDGDIDLVIANQGLWDNSRLFENLQGQYNNWVQIDLVGTISNKAAIGARVRVVAGGISQIREISGGSGYCSQNSLTAEFGLGTAVTVDSVIITWPSGTVQDTTLLAINTRHVLTEPVGAVICGDANSDLALNVGDAVYLINYVFKSGPASVPLCKSDANDDNAVNVGDAVYMINYVFKSGPVPPPTCCP
ncbi:MAG: hypothetical protein GY841_07840, partial [FCB group bacterium]|nr:hypothetical protein [FCB group bacterium]